MSRCAACNSLGFDPLSVEEVRASGTVNEEVISKVSEFWACRGCRKVYWEGPKFDTAVEKFRKLVDDSDEEEGPEGHGEVGGDHGEEPQ